MIVQGNVALSHDPVHHYIPFIDRALDMHVDEVTEREIIDSAWVQRLREIHQLQTAWYVFPTAEHTRFQHVLGAMHLASSTVSALYDSLMDTCPDVPSRGYVECLLRMAGLLHDVGHGPFGHFFDDHFLRHFGLTHEVLGARIICEQLGPLLERIRRNPHGQLREDERLDARQIAWLIMRPKPGEDAAQPQWLVFLRSLLAGIYTIDNMDFVLRDAYMSGYSQRSFDLERLLYYSFFSSHGLTINDRGLDALLRFMRARSELFQAIYFHRTVRAMDLALTELFEESRGLLFPGNPLDHLEEYQLFTEWSLVVEVKRWSASSETRRRQLGERWRRLLNREIPWKMLCQRSLLFSEADAERSSIFSDARLVEQQIRQALPAALSDIPLRADIARHIHRPHTRGPAAHQNFLFDTAQARVRPLSDNQLFRYLPVSHRFCRIYGRSADHAAEVAQALDTLIGPGSEDDLTNM